MKSASGPESGAWLCSVRNSAMFVIRLSARVWGGQSSQVRILSSAPLNNSNQCRAGFEPEPNL